MKRKGDGWDGKRKERENKRWKVSRWRGREKVMKKKIRKEK